MTTKLEKRVAHLEALVACLVDHQGDVAMHIQMAGVKIWKKFSESLTAHLEDAEKKPKAKARKRK